MHIITIDSIIIIIITTSSPIAEQSSHEPCTQPPTNKFNRFHFLARQSRHSDGAANTGKVTLWLCRAGRDAQNATGTESTGKSRRCSCQKMTELLLPSAKLHTLCSYVHDICFLQICHFRPINQPNPLKQKFSIHYQLLATTWLDWTWTQPYPTSGSTQPMEWTTLM